MTVEEFLREILAEVRSEMQGSSPYGELVFSEIVMHHLAESGMTFDDPIVCHFKGRVGNSHLRLSGYSMAEDGDQLDLFVTLFEGSDELSNISESETKTAAEQCVKFLALCANGTMARHLEESSDARSLALLLHECYDKLDQIRIYVITDRVARNKTFKTRDIAGKLVRLEVMDIERLFRHVSEGKPRDELVVNFTEVSGAPLPCVFIPGQGVEYDYALTAVPGEALRHLYEKFSTRLLEANVRSFLSAKGAVNSGIQNTLRNAPARFMAYNNGVVIVADELKLGQTPEGGTGIAWLKGMQIVNGGQTTASIFFTKRKNSDTDLSAVRVPAKIIVLKPDTEAAQEEALISDISRFANTQNVVKQSDLSANKPFHVEVEKLSLSVFCPDGVSRWFYERAAGSYNTLLAREGSTPARLRALKEQIPPARRITKTDLAKYLNTWDQKPDVVSLGLQKNFQRFMDEVAPTEGEPRPLPSVADYKAMIAKAKLFKDAHKLIRPMFPQSQGNVVIYTLSLLANRLGHRVDLERIWKRQGASPELLAFIQTWAREVNEVIQAAAAGRLISEYAKKPDCKRVVVEADYSAPPPGIPELLNR
jgi:hypothetical protein